MSRSFTPALARGGDAVTLNWRIGARPQMAAQRRVASLVNARRMLSPLASWYVTDILKDAPPPLNAKGGRFAYKTGTSYGYRDAWAIGYDGRHVVAAWIGRPDGASVPGLMGRNAAAPILFDAFERISQKRAAAARAARGCGRRCGRRSTAAAEALARARRRHGRRTLSHAASSISFPPDGSELDNGDLADEPLILKADGGALPLTWMIDGAPISSDPHAREATWRPTGPGFAKLTVIDANGRADRASNRFNKIPLSPYAGRAGRARKAC